MGVLWFTDGERFDTSGPIRKEKRQDGWYVIGQGILIPANSESDADQLVARYSTVKAGTFMLDIK